VEEYRFYSILLVRTPHWKLLYGW